MNNDDVVLAGQAIAGFGAAVAVLIAIAPENLQSQLQKYSGSFGVFITGVAAIIVGFAISTFGG